MPYDTGERDLAVRRQRQQSEALRVRTFATVLKVLTWLAPDLGINRAYIFGSVVRPDVFGSDSDIDVALQAGDQIRAASLLLTHAIGREVHVVLLDGSEVAKRAAREGTIWNRES